MSQKQRRIAKQAAIGTAVTLSAVVWLKVASMLLLTTAGTSAWHLGNHPDSERLFGPVGAVNVIEPHRAHFNLGTALAAQEKLLEAQRSLRTALTLTNQEDECVVRLNLALVLEGLTAQAAKTSDTAGAEAYRKDAATVLSEASASCRTGPLASIAKRAGGGEPPPSPAPQDPSEPGDEATREQPVMIPAEGDAALSELESRMAQGQKAQASEDAAPGRGKPQPVSRPW